MRTRMVILTAVLMLALGWCSPPADAAEGARSSTAYCLHGRGGWVHQAIAAAQLAGHRGMVAVPRTGRAGSVPLGTVLWVSDGPAGPGTYVAGDRIGWGSQLDFAMPGDCRGARQWGRRTVVAVRV